MEVVVFRQSFPCHGRVNLTVENQRWTEPSLASLSPKVLTFVMMKDFLFNPMFRFPSTCIYLLVTRP